MDSNAAAKWEEKLRKWKNPPSQNEDNKRNRTEGQIRSAIQVSDALRSRGFVVYAKGSYANNTNVRLDYDVDIAVECNEFFYSSQIGKAAKVAQSSLGINNYSGGYSVGSFKSEVEDALVAEFGRNAVSRGDIALRVRENKTTLPADVVPCFEYRLYNDISSTSYLPGHRVFPRSGDFINNFPKLQLDYGTRKNDRTGRRYKRMARILKTLENEMSGKNLISDLPSYLMECLAYNVPDSYYGNDRYLDDLEYTLLYLYSRVKVGGSYSDLYEVNEVKHLFRSDASWSVLDVRKFVAAAWNYIGFD